MASLYDLLVSPDQATEAAALQDALRRRAAAGAMLQGTGDRALAPMGLQLGKSADEDTGRMVQAVETRLRQALMARELKQRQQAAEQENALKNYQAMSKEAADAAEAKYRQDVLGYKGKELDIEREKLRLLGDKTAATPPRPARTPAQARMPEAFVKDLESLTDAYDSVTALQSRFKPEYAGKGLAGETGVGIAKRLGSWAPADTQEMAAFWADWDKLVNLPERNKTFGASLSANEQRSWEGARVIKPGTDPRLIQAKFAELATIAKSKGAARARGGAAEGYSEDAIREYTRGRFEDGPVAGSAPTRRRWNPQTQSLE